MISRTKAIIKKEFKHLLRDKRMLFVLIFFPAFLLAMFGYAVNFDVQNVKLAVYDQDKSELSRDFISRLSTSAYFDLVKVVDSQAEVTRCLNDKIAQTVLVIPNDLSEKVNKRKEEATVQFLVDGVDGNIATIIMNYVNFFSVDFNSRIQSDILAKAGVSLPKSIDVETIFWFNPDLKSTRFLMPGLIVMILIITIAISVSLSLVKEKERGTIEQINVSSLNTLELLIGKCTPYMVVSLVDTVAILLVGFILFDVAIKGSLLLLFITTFVFLLAAASQGIFISVLADNQQVAFSVATISTMLPSTLLSGFIFPIENMPKILQLVTNITPATFFIRILRAIMLRGVGMSAIWDQVGYLLIFTLIFLTLASIMQTKKLKKA